MEFRVILTDHAVFDLENITQNQIRQIHRDLKALESSPFSPFPKIRRLKKFRIPTYRLRSGDYRILYRVEGDTVTILRVIDRKVLERVIKRLPI